MEEKSWSVYIIQAENGNLYTGITNDLENRFKAHKTQKGARFFRISSPQKVLFSEKCLNRSEASKRESFIKKLTRKEKLTLISKEKG